MVSSANAVPEAIRRELLPSGSAVVPQPDAVATELSREVRKYSTFLKKTGAGEGIRTLDPNLGKVCGMNARYFSGEGGFVTSARIVARALKLHGVEDLRAALAAQIGMAAFTHATISWLDDPTLNLDEHLDRACRGLQSLLT